ncbi:uncharacterized protein LOC111704092 [Eurytemora carolleeae]|uniref:uncharacterized protein LOC111704092 n=1 Tax=Eurytemora carolleeae TaxID=1294199 RepID=UPI000C78E8DC|nr:uncharacterized protein LOC111704092 [Eurytemora carolleeae]|eukprot:XP_023331999.1 uncharacterized protein LOC111704092 [Eurytemora affinis]
MTFRFKMDNLVPIDELESDIKHIVTQSLLTKVMQETLTQEEVSDWLSWCRKQTNQLKLINYDIPAGILPSSTSASLTDIKVDGRGPDDKIYHNNQQIRDKVARGNTVLSLFNSSTKETIEDLVIFALRKFTGGMGDEDEEQPENDLVWKKYFLKPVECVERIVVMHKENIYCRILYCLVCREDSGDA